MPTKLTPRERLSKARINLLTDYPFYGNLVMKLILREVTEEESKLAGVPTMAVDLYGNLMWNPSFVEKLNDNELKCALVHEVMHCALNHLTRVGTRDQRIWNIAVDSAVNEVLSKTFRIPDTWVRNPQMAKKCAEEIYDWIIKNAQEQKFPPGWDEHIFGVPGGKDGNAFSPFQKPGQQPFDTARAIREAYNFAKAQGKLPAGIDRLFANILNPNLDWKDILRKYIVAAIPHDFTYIRPSKKSYSAGFYMPTVLRESIELVIGVDSSGSISDREYAEFLSEIYAICKQFESLKATVIVCDAAVQEVIEINENFDPYCVHGRGYGGTESQPVYDYITETLNAHNVKLLVYFTDGYITIPKGEYPFPTLWVVTAKGRTNEVEKMQNATVIQIPREDFEDD